MNLLDALTTLVDSARQQAETPHLKHAIRRAEARIEQLRYKRNQRLENLRVRGTVDLHLVRIIDAEKVQEDICLLNHQLARAQAKLTGLQAPIP